MLGYDWAKTDVLSKEVRARYVALVQYLTGKNLVASRMLLERLEESTLTGCALIADSNLFMRKRVRIQTRITYIDEKHFRYEQQKFNLLREESEGFAKVVTELTIHQLTEAVIPTVLTNIQSLIGNNRSFIYG